MDLKAWTMDLGVWTMDFGDLDPGSTGPRAHGLSLTGFTGPRDKSHGSTGLRDHGIPYGPMFPAQPIRHQRGRSVPKPVPSQASLVKGRFRLKVVKPLRRKLGTERLWELSGRAGAGSVGPWGMQGFHNP